MRSWVIVPLEKRTLKTEAGLRVLEFEWGCNPEHALAVKTPICTEDVTVGVISNAISEANLFIEAVISMPSARRDWQYHNAATFTGGRTASSAGLYTRFDISSVRWVTLTGRRKSRPETVAPDARAASCCRLLLEVYGRIDSSRSAKLSNTVAASTRFPCSLKCA